MTRVVITGMGALTPIGNSVSEFQTGLAASKVGFNQISHFDATETGITLAGELSDFDPLKRLSKKDLRRMDAFSQYAMYATAEAVEQAGIDETNTEPESMGVIYGSGIGGLTTIQEQVTKMVEKGPQRVSPMFVPTAISNMRQVTWPFATTPKTFVQRSLRRVPLVPTPLVRPFVKSKRVAHKLC